MLLSQPGPESYKEKNIDMVNGTFERISDGISISSSTVIKVHLVSIDGYLLG